MDDNSESQVSEFKKSLADSNGIGAALCGFLNCQEVAQLFIGVSPQGRRLGINVADKTQQEIANIIRQIEPCPTIEMAIELLETGKSIVILKTISNFEHIPYIYKGRPYSRIGTTTTMMPQDKYHELLDRRHYSKVRWEQMPAHIQSIDDLDVAEILQTLRDGTSYHRIPEEVKGNPIEILSKLDLIRDGKFTHAAYILFGKNVRSYYPQCLTRIARFNGVSKTAAFTDERHIWGNVFCQLKEAMHFLERHIPKAFKLQDGNLQRQDVPLIPFSVLREALINAICHRDYANGACSIEIGLYDDRIEIWSPGGLPQGITLDMLQTQHPSIPRNDAIAHVFFRRGLIEQWGTGTLKMVEQCSKAELSPPIFNLNAGHLVVTFPVRLKQTSEVLRTNQVLTDRQQQLLQLLLMHRKMTLKEMHFEIKSVSTRTLQRELQTLNKLQLVIQEGVGVGSSWRIAPNSAK